MSDTPKDILGFHARVLDGGEVWPYRGGKVVKRPIKGPLKLGQRVCVPSLFGYADAKVTDCGDGRATATSGQTSFPLSFAADDRGCWTCSTALDMRALASIIW